MYVITEELVVESEKIIDKILFQENLLKTLKNMLLVREVSHLCIRGPEGIGQSLATQAVSTMAGGDGSYITLNPYELERKDPAKLKKQLEYYFEKDTNSVIRIIKADILNTNPHIYLILDLIKNYIKNRNDKIVVIEGDYESIDFIQALSPDLFLKFQHVTARPLTQFELIEILTKIIEDNNYVLDPGFKRNIKDVIEQIRPVGDLVNARIADSMANIAMHKAKTLKTNVIRSDYVDKTLFKTVNRKNLTGYEELDSLIGLTDVKETVKLWMANSSLAKRREKLGLVAPGAGQHMIFKGPAGTAKTSVARIVGKILAETNVLTSGHVVEVQKGDLIADSPEQASRNVTDYVKKSIGGVLFIDEAYTLTVTDRSENNHSKEVIDTLLKLMEDYRDEFIVIAAGYTTPMEQFLNSNPGLRSRFMRIMEFPGYTIDQLFEILDYMVTQRGFTLDPSVKGALLPRLQLVSQYPGFGNGRHIRNIIDKAVVQQGFRVTEKSTDLEFSTLTVEDFKEALNAQVAN